MLYDLPDSININLFQQYLLEVHNITLMNYDRVVSIVMNSDDGGMVILYCSGSSDGYHSVLLSSYFSWIRDKNIDRFI